jgi:uncharacterized protein
MRFMKTGGEHAMRKTRWGIGWMAAAVLSYAAMASAGEKLKTLIVDGQNNHDWKSCTPILKQVLEGSGRFAVEVSTAPDKKDPPAKWESWRPVFKGHDVVVLNYNGQDWPEPVRKEFVDYMRDGGGLVVVHAADNSFPGWVEFNEMIGLGGWGGRNEKSGPMIRWRDGKIVEDKSPGAGGTHGKQHEFVVETRVPDHPITKGLPLRWKHATDELYSKLRGPAKNLTVLATAYAAPDMNGTGENEPILMVLSFGKGRVFHTVLGHGPLAMSGVGFKETLKRGAEWAATGEVTFAPVKAEELPAEGPAGVRK